LHATTAKQVIWCEFLWGNTFFLYYSALKKALRLIDALWLLAELIRQSQMQPEKWTLRSTNNFPTNNYYNRRCTDPAMSFYQLKVIVHLTVPLR